MLQQLQCCSIIIQQFVYKVHQIVLTINGPQCAEPHLPVESGLMRHQHRCHLCKIGWFIPKLILLPLSEIIGPTNHQFRSTPDPSHLPKQPIAINHVKIRSVLIGFIRKFMVEKWYLGWFYLNPLQEGIGTCHKQQETHYEHEGKGQGTAYGSQERVPSAVEPSE